MFAKGEKPPAGVYVDVSELTPAHFEPLSGSEFLVDNGRLSLKLVEVSPAKRPRENARPFSIVFEGSRQVPLEQSLYSISHPQLGCMDLFLVPIEQDDVSRRYEAVFN